MATNNAHQDDDNKQKEDKITGNPERLQDEDHKMDKRDNEVQGEVDYDQNRHHPNAEPNQDIEKRWPEIESDYRKHYPKITDEDVRHRSSEFDQIANRIAKRTNRTPEEVKKEIRAWDKGRLNR